MNWLTRFLRGGRSAAKPRPMASKVSSSSGRVTPRDEPRRPTSSAPPETRPLGSSYSTADVQAVARKSEVLRKHSTDHDYASDEAGRLHQQADQLALAGQFRAAVSTYTEALQRKPIYEGYTNRGAAYVRLRDYRQAELDFTSALELEPNHPQAYINFNNRGYARREAGDVAAALADFDTAIQLSPTYAEAFFNKADAHMKVGQSQEAAAAYEAFLRLAPPGLASLCEVARRKLATLR